MPPVAWAQEGEDTSVPAPAVTENGEAQVIDPITAAEQAIALPPEGAGGAGTITTGSSVWNIIRILLTLAVVAAAIYGLVFFVKKFSRGNTSQDPFLKILASTPLGTSRAAYVISVGSQAWLVGAAESGVNLISEIKDKDILDAMLLEDSKKSAETPSGRLPDFKSFLRKFGMSANPEAPGAENIRKRRERLKGL